MRRLLFSLGALGLLFFPAAALAGFAPADRATLQCVNVVTEDCPGSNYVTFNSFTDSPVPDAPSNGDERAFFEVKDSTSSTTTQDGFNDNLSVRDGERVMLRVYIHNDANPLTSGVDTTAHNTIVEVQLPAAVANPYTATASIRADNATPHEVTDTVTLNGSAPFNLTFDRTSVNIIARVNGQGDFVTNAANNVAFTNDNTLVVNLGDWPGGFKNHGVLTMSAVVHNAVTAPVQPVSFMCTQFSADSSNNFTAITNPQNANATVSSYVFTVKDVNGNVVDTKTVNSSASSATYLFNQTNPGTYTVSAVANSDKGSTASSACSRQITVNAPAQVAAATTTVGKSATLPNTGAGDILGAFTGISALGGAGHYFVKRRR